MTIKTFAIATLVASAFGALASVATAQTSRLPSVPANIPPSGYTGAQFVDNTGCIYVRAGFDGAETWVPRVSRTRQHICGQTPTFNTSQPAPTVQTAAVSKPVQITGPLTTSAKVVRAPASKPVNAQPPRVVRRVPAAAAPLPVTIAAAPAPAAVASAPKRRVVVQRSAPAQGLRNNTIIVPQHVYEHRDTQNLHVPQGFRPAWSDDRLNPYRAYQTVQGYRATQQVWTNRVPRDLVSKAKRHKIKKPVIAYRVTDKAPVAGTTLYRAPVVSSKSAPATTASRYVEVGLFSSPAKANAAVSRLQRAGLPVKIGKAQHNGQAMQRVVVGPFASASAVSDALGATHRTGYTQAYLR